MPVTMWLLLVHGNQECLGVGPVCDMGLPRFQHVLLSKFQEQKLNTKSSNKAEIVGVSDCLPNVICARMFLEDQGFLIDEKNLFQDNQSAIKIEYNGKASSVQKTKYMDKIYIWIKARLQSEGIKVEYFLTEKMILNFFTKPLQGALFNKFRDIVLGYKHISILHEDDKDSSPQECVVKDVSKGSVKRSYEGPSFVGGTHLGNVKMV